MALAFGEKIVSKVYFGEKAVSAIYLGTKKVFPEEEEELPVSGDIRLRIQTTAANQSFPLFYEITTESGGYVSVDWGDGNKETLTGKTLYQPTHTYTTAGEYIVKLTGSKFTGVEGVRNSSYADFQTAVKEILSLKMPTDSTSVSLSRAFFGCDNLTGSIPEWDDCIVNTDSTYCGCSGLTGNIPAWGANITDACYTYQNCFGLTGRIPKWGANIVEADSTYQGCSGLTGNIPAWGAKITSAYFTYNGCPSLTGNIPAWGPKITNADSTYKDSRGLTGCSAELLQDPMPSRITRHDFCVSGCVDEIRQHFTPDWGGTKFTGSGDIRLRIETTSANAYQPFSLFYKIKTEEGGFVFVDWGDGTTETFTGKTIYSLKHFYNEANEYVIKLTGSKFTEVEGFNDLRYDDFQNAVREILSLKMPTDSKSVSLYNTFKGCKNLTGDIPAWDDRITVAAGTYHSCTGLTGSIPTWGANITDTNSTYSGCTGLTGEIPAWGAKITSAYFTYYSCFGLTVCSEELLQDPMPSGITSHSRCVSGCVDEIQKHFTPDWGGRKEELPGTGDIRLRIETGTNGGFKLFYKIWTEEGGYVSIDWGDGNTETLTEMNTVSGSPYSPSHIYAEAGEYIVKLTGSKFVNIAGLPPGSSSTVMNTFMSAVREILSLKMPTDSKSVSLYNTFKGCKNLTGDIPAWDDRITSASYTYCGCSGLTGSIPEWGANIKNASYTYEGCTGLTGSIPAWVANITDAGYTYEGCTGLTGEIPAWGANITDAYFTYQGCSGLTGNIPEWGANIVDADFAYGDCTGLTGNIPAWGAKINYVQRTYVDCTGLTGCSDELLQDPMPSRIKARQDCVYGCVDEIRKHFTEAWGGTLPD